jgi:hypothetical protein
MNKKIIYNYVNVYTDLIPNIQDVYQTLKSSESAYNGQYLLREWSKWSVFGTYSSIKFNPNPQHEESFLQDKDQEFINLYNKEKEAYLAIINAYEIAIDDYLSTYQVAMPENWNKVEPSFCKYNEFMDYDMGEGLTMQYHTDFFEAEAELPGHKFFITCTMYINDDYDGGDISFYINGNEFNYKPEPGSIVIFPSKPPFYHGVKKVSNGEKFLVRKFITYPYSGSQEWLKNQMNHGPIKWAEMEKERLEAAKENQVNFVFGENAVSYPEDYAFSFIQ